MQKKYDEMTGKAKILFIVDSPKWAHDFKTDSLVRWLANDYRMRKCYKSSVKQDDIEWADVVVVYYWKEFNDPNMQKLSAVFEQNRHKLLLGICSHIELQGRFREEGLKVLQKLGRAIFVNSALLYKEFAGLFNVPVFCTPNGVDTDFFTPGETKGPSKSLRVGWAGSFTNNGEVRGFDEFIVPAINLVEGAELIVAAREQKWRSRDEMREFYRSLDIYICASQSESGPNPCLEAAATGVPLLTTRVGVMPELVIDGVNGLFIDRDVRDIAEKLKLLRDNWDLRLKMGKAILESIREWDWQKKAENYRWMFDAVLSSRKKLPLMPDNPLTVDYPCEVVSDFKPENFRQASESKEKGESAAVKRSREMLKPKFSIVMVNFNNGRYICHAIESVLNQTFKDWELIIVDDCSTDDSVDVINRYLKDNRIRLIRHDANKGCSAAHKTAIAAVKSEFFGVLDSDDCLRPNAVETMYKHHIMFPDCGFIYSQFVYCDERLNPTHLGFCRGIPPGKTTLDVEAVSHFKTFKMRDYLKTPGYDERVRVAVDEDIIYKMEEATKFKFVDECLYLCREGPDSISHGDEREIIARATKERVKFATLKRRGQARLATDYFLKAQEEFQKGSFAQAAALMTEYRKVLDYSQLPRVQSKSRRKGNIDVSVVIVTYNRTEDVKKCLESLNQQDDINFETIVVDNGGTDFERLEPYVDQYIKCPINFVLSEGRNIGVCCARGKIVAFLDDDALVPADFVSSIKAAFQIYDIFGLRGRALPKTDPRANKGMKCYDLGPCPFPTLCDLEGCSAFRKDIFLSMNGMDPLLFGHEGIDLTYRMISKFGLLNRIIYWPHTVIFHDNIPFDDKESRMHKQARHDMCLQYLLIKHNRNIVALRPAIEKQCLPDFAGICADENLRDSCVVDSRYSKPNFSIVQPCEVHGNYLVSVVMPAYNAQDYISRAIEGVLIQNYRNFELIVIDDGSTDKTAEIVRGFKDQRIKYCFKENSGVAASRNFGLEMSGGSFIVMLDSDDMMTPDYIARHLQVFEMFPQTDMVYCDECLIDDQDRPIGVTRRPEYSSSVAFISDMFRKGFPPVHFKNCIRRDVFDKIGLYDERLIIAEDYDMMRRFAQKGLRMCHLRVPLYLRRMNIFGLSKNLSAAKVKSHFEVIRRFKETFIPEELFPYVQWSCLSGEQKELMAKYNTAVVYIGIGNQYLKTNVPAYVSAAFDMACTELDDCCKIAPDYPHFSNLREKCRFVQLNRL